MADLCDMIKDKLCKFVKELMSLYPKETLFSMYYVKLQLSSPVDIMGSVLRGLLPNADKVTERDFSFFHARLIAEFKALQAAGLAPPQIDEEAIRRLELIWAEMGTDNRDLVWKWVDSFVKIGRKYNETKTK